MSYSTAWSRPASFRERAVYGGMMKTGCTPDGTHGFTLVEIAVALFIVALVLGTILGPLATQVERRKVSDTQKALEEIKEALIGFAVAKGYLPCPAISATNGLEDRTVGVGGVCNKRQGFIPWATLGVSKLDGWGNIFRYSVTPTYTTQVTLTGRDITIQSKDGAGTIINLTNVPPNGVPAVVLSHGKNGYGAFNDQGTLQAPPTPADWSANFDENINATGTTTFVSRRPQAAGALGAGGEFDDIVDWLSPNILYNRMIAAGKLP